MQTEKRKHSAEFKVKILKEHLEQQVPIGKLCEQHNLHPDLIYLWKKELFSEALKTFSKKKNTLELKSLRVLKRSSKTRAH